MGYREEILRPRGYRVSYATRPGYRGNDPKTICTAERDGVSYYVSTDVGHYSRIHEIQDSIPHMARIMDRVERAVVFEAAQGELLWHIDSPSNIDDIERQLIEFGRATERNGLIHADLRPWNVFVHYNGSGCTIKVIDWGLSRFVDQLTLGDDLLEKHLTTMHRGRRIVELAGIDLADARRIGRLLRGEIKFAEAWPQNPPLYPAWCRH